MGSYRGKATDGRVFSIVMWLATKHVYNFVGWMGTLLATSAQIASIPALKAQITYSCACSPPHHTGRVDVWQCIRAFQQQRANQCLILLHPSHDSMHLILPLPPKNMIVRSLFSSTLIGCDKSQHDLVSAQTSSACITHHTALNAIACMCQTIRDVTFSNVLGRLVQSV